MHMKNVSVTRGVLIVGAMTMILLSPLTMVFATEGSTTITHETDMNTEVKASDTGESEAKVNAATSEVTSKISGSGTLVEIGNTTAANTTIIVRQKKSDGTTKDVTLEITEHTTINTNSRRNADLSDWIAGDNLSFNATEYENSGQIVATVVVNHAFMDKHKGHNGWITAIRADKNEIDVKWQDKIYTLNVATAKMVAGVKNPATMNDLKVNDRVRSRVVEDNDGNSLTWKAEIVVVLRRGNDLFMRVTRWAVPAKIVNLPQSLTLPTTIEVEVLPSKFYQEGDVNNLVGKPGTRMFVDILEDTNLVRKYLGKALLAEFSEGDQVRIIGKRDETTGHLVASFVKDESIQRLGVSSRFGKVTAIDTANSTLTVMLQNTLSTYKTWTVKVSPTTKLYKDGAVISMTDIKVGDIIRVRGTANTATYAVNATMAVVVMSSRLDLMLQDRAHLDGLKDFLR